MSFINLFRFILFYFYIICIRDDTDFTPNKNGFTKKIQQYGKNNYTRCNDRCFSIQPKVVLIGSSIISRWNLTNILGFKKIKNNGISGLFTEDLFKTNLDFSNPKYIIFYCGGNDLRNNISPYIIINNINQYLEFLRKQYPNTMIILLSILISDFMKHLKKESNIISKMYKELSNKYPNNIIYINVNRKINKNPDYYDSDGIHLNRKGYDKLQNIIESHIYI
jgi:lysophospholipase L1-like esterase